MPNDEKRNNQPAAPVAPPTASPVQPGATPLSQADMKMAIERDLNQIRFRKSRVDEQMANNKVESESLRKQILNSIFGALREAGVDPSNQASISAFMQRLEEQDPDLVIMLMTALEGLTAGMGGQPEEGMMPEGPPQMMGAPGQMPGEVPENPLTGMMAGRNQM